MVELLQPAATAGGRHPGPAGIFDAGTLPAERLEAEICSLAGHVAAAQCRFLILVGEYDAREAWAAWDMPSCAAWLAWRCQMAPGTAREHVRTARALRQLPLVCKEFAAGRMSYAKARELTRIAAPDTEAGLIEITRAMTAGQAERFARAHRQATEAEANAGQPKAARRKLTWRWDEETGELSISVHLPAADGAVVLQALRAATGDLDHPHDDHDDEGADVSAQTRPEPLKVATENLAEALTEVAGAYLAGKVAAADNADIYQVIIHTTPHGLTAPGPAPQPDADVPAGTSAGHPVAPGRCHLEDGPAIPFWTAQLAACNATVSVMLHDAAGEVLNVGRRSRTATARIRRAVRERDRYRCTFAGCESRRTDLHHIIYWRNGGCTSMTNCLLLCRTHHTLVHDRGYIITRGQHGWVFTTPGGTTLPPAGQLPPADRDIAALHGAGITPATITPPHSGERLDLNLAIWIALNNGRIRQEQAPQLA
jgi:5-methylcytosine-specific restriction endonuclease McrA